MKLGFMYKNAIPLFFLIFFTLSCKTGVKNYTNKNLSSRTVSVLGKDGKYKEVERIVPDFNAKVLSGEIKGINNIKEINIEENDRIVDLNDKAIAEKFKINQTKSKNDSIFIKKSKLKVK